MTSRQSRVQYVLGILLAVTPVTFVWTTELLITTSELTDTELTFFIWGFPPLVAYHTTMYVMFFVSWMGAFNLIHRCADDTE
jgi:hypothetical protein